MSDLLEEMNMIMTIIWWLQKLERERETVSKYMGSAKVCYGQI